MGEIQKPTLTEVQIIIDVSDCRLCSHNIPEVRQLSWNNTKLGIKKAWLYFSHHPVVWPRASHFITLNISTLFLPFCFHSLQQELPDVSNVKLDLGHSAWFGFTLSFAGDEVCFDPCMYEDKSQTRTCSAVQRSMSCCAPYSHHTQKQNGNPIICDIQVH